MATASKKIATDETLLLIKAAIEALPNATQAAADNANAAATAANNAVATLGALVADTYSTSATYKAGEYAYYDGKLYRCIVPITTGEAWTAAHWEQVQLGEDVFSVKNTIKADVKIQNAVLSVAANAETQIPFFWENGHIDGTTGEDVTRDANQRSMSFVPLYGKTAKVRSVNNNVVVYLYEYDEDFNFLEVHNTTTSYISTVNQNTKFIRVSTYSATVQQSDLHTYIVGYWENSTNYEKDLADLEDKYDLYINELEAKNVIVPIVILYSTDLVDFPIPQGSVFNIYPIDGQTFDTNKVQMYASDGTTLVNEWNLGPGSDVPRVITNNAGDGKYVKLGTASTRGIALILKSYATESVYLGNRVNDLSNMLIDNQTVQPFVMLRDTSLVEFHIPTGSNLIISTIDGKVFEANTIERYDSDGTTKLGDWGVVPANGTHRDITYNGAAMTYLKLVTPTTRGIKVTLLNAVKQPKKVRLMQYNIGKFNYGQGGGLSADVATKIANYKRFLAEYQPNICGIEEYTQYIDSASSYGSDATLFNDLYFFEGKDFDVELAVKSDYASRRFYNFYIKDDNNETAGSFVEYDADIEGTKVIIVAGAIAAGKSASVRAGGFENLLKKYASDTNVVMLIDTNVISQQEHTDLVTTCGSYNYKVANGGYFGSFDTYNLNSQYYHKIDNVLVKGDIVLKNVIVPDVYADLSSDHYPLIADIEVKVD